MRVTELTEQYKDGVRKVCISQSTSRFKDETARKATLALYCDEYIEHELCFVLLDDQDEVQGYILCAPDLHRWEENMQPYVALLKEIDDDKYHRYFGTAEGGELLYPAYPAHLHIDIREEYTGGGNGTKLMQTLLAKLKEMQVPGIHVMVDPNNKRAVSFYQKMGFVCIDDNGSVYVQKL